MDGASGIKFDAGTAMACLWAGIAFWFITHCAVSGARRWMGARNTPLHGRAQGNSLVPCAQVAIPAEVKVDDAGDMHPAEGRDIGNRVMRSRQPWLVGQMLIECRERRFRQLPQAGDGGGVRRLIKQFEMHALAQEGPHARGVEHEPGNGRPAFRRLRRQ